MKKFLVRDVVVIIFIVNALFLSGCDKDAAPLWAAPQNDIMRVSRTGVVLNQDVVMLLIAWSTNRPQNFPES